jgi:hypothetical protein
LPTDRDGLTARQRHVLVILDDRGPQTLRQLEVAGAGERVHLVCDALRRKGLVKQLGRFDLYALADYRVQV